MNKVSLAAQVRKVKSVFGTNGKRAAPYRVCGRALIKNVQESHIWREKQAVGIDEAVWQAQRAHAETVRFNWWDGRVFSIPAEEFERRSFIHGDGARFAVTRFVKISELRIVREKRENPHQLSLFAPRVVT